MESVDSCEQSASTSCNLKEETRGWIHMKKLLLSVALFSSVALCTTLPARAQFGGCDDSPENPTLILAGLASGAFAVSQVRTRMRAKRTNKDQ